MAILSESYKLAAFILFPSTAGYCCHQFQQWVCKYPLLCAGHNVSRLGLSEATREHNDGVNLETYKGPAVTAIPSRSVSLMYLTRASDSAAGSKLYILST